MQIKIERMDHIGNGIGYIDGKVIFVPKTIPGDIVDVSIVSNKKTFMKGKVNSYISRSEVCKDAFCPFYDKCSGCHLQNFSYEDTLVYKENRIKNIFNKLDINPSIEIVSNDNPTFYRNKVSLKIQNGILGYYEEKSNNIVEIDYCMITKKCINNFLSVIKSWNLENALVTIRCNYNNELLISIQSSDEPSIDFEILPEYRVVGVVLNNECIYGENHFLEKVQDLFFEVSYDSFFQVNGNINSKLFDIIKTYASGDTVLDLYSGVGTLSIMASRSAKKVYAIETVPNAVVNALKNGKINRASNVNFILGNVEDKIKLIEDKIDTVIIDPPRKGIDEFTQNKILELMPEKIIFVSCETQKFTHDIKLFLEYYNIKKAYVLDMFSYTYHCESVVVLERK